VFYIDLGTVSPLKFVVIRRTKPKELAVLRHRSGEEIRKGDQVPFQGNPAEVELVAHDPDDPESSWHVKEHGGGVSILDPKVSSRTFIPGDQLEDYEDLEFVSRK